MEHKQATVESRAIYYAELTAVVAAVLAQFIFWGHLVALFGGDSIGSVASVLAAVAAFVGFLLSWRAR